MTQFNARLMNVAVIRRIAELTDDVSAHTQDIADALAEYENASELSGQDRTEAREEAREQFVQSWSDLMSTTDELRDEHDRITAFMEEA